MKVLLRKKEEDERLFQLLNSAYTDARLKKNYKITLGELELLVRRIERLRDAVKEIKEKVLNWIFDYKIAFNS